MQIPPAACNLYTFCAFLYCFRRRVADEIVASVGNTQEDEVDAERDENDVSDGDVAGATATTSAAAARKKPKRRRY